MSEKICATCKHANGHLCNVKIRGDHYSCVDYDAWGPADAKNDCSPDGFLRRAAEVLAERGKDYDDGRERSMGKAVDAFNVITGAELTERDGWLFMQVLKLVRLTTAEGFHRDSYEDNIAYAA